MSAQNAVGGRSFAPIIPVRLLRDLFASCQIGAESRVLEVGCGDGQHIGFMRHMGIMAEGQDDSGIAPTADNKIHAVPLTAPPPFAPQSFDMVLFRRSRVHEASLSSPEACTGTANLLSCLKPGGRVVLLDPQQPESGHKPDPARIQAWNEHFSVYPGNFSERSYSEGLGWFLTMKFLFQSPLDVRILMFTLPSVAISRLEWHRRAREAVMKLQRKVA